MRSLQIAQQQVLAAIRQHEYLILGQTLAQSYRAGHAPRATPPVRHKITDRHARKLAARAFNPANPVRRLALHRHASASV